jgi:hypothetical protein
MAAYTLTVTLKVDINGDSKELAADHLAKMIADHGLTGIELAALTDIIVRLRETGFDLAPVPAK